MVACAYCGKNELLPFNCPYCGRRFCVEHRIPESHHCSELAAFRAISPSQREGEPASPTYGRIYWLHTSAKELAHLSGAIAVAFLVEGLRILYLFRFSGRALPILSAIMLGSVSAFLLHELAHKLVAQHYGMWAEFRLDRMGVLMSLVTAIPFLPFKLLAPGRMVIFGRPTTQDTIGKVTLAGILTNLGLAVTFTAIAPSYPLLFYAAILNAELAFFNLLPFSVFDGRGIFNWNKRVWLIVFGVTVILWLYLLTI